MSKYHVIHGSVAANVGKGAEAERKTYEVGETFEMDDADAKPLLGAGTIAKGAAPSKDGAKEPAAPPADEEKIGAQPNRPGR